MPWTETCAMDQNVQFVAAAQRGEVSFSALCAQFRISRKTGSTWLERYRAAGVDGLKDRARARHHQAHATPAASQTALVALKGQYPHWGPKKLVARWRTQQARGSAPADVPIPAPSTAGAILKQHGLVQARRPRRPLPPGRTAPPAPCTGPNTLWCADCTGQFQLGDGRWCDPFTRTDAASRRPRRCQALPSTATTLVHPLLAVAFREFGLPVAIRTDHGPPFASQGLGGPTPRSVWWTKLGIVHDRIDPGRPRQHGRHERLHRTLGAEAWTPPAPTLAAQHRAFAAVRRQYNHERPHAALDGTPAADHYPAPPVLPARRFSGGVPAVRYPEADAVRRVRPTGMLRWQGRDIDVTQALVGEPVGLVALGAGQWEVHVAHRLLAILDDPTGRLWPVARRPLPPDRPPP